MRRSLPALTLAAVVGLTACTADDPQTGPAPSGSASTFSVSPVAPATSASPTAAPGTSTPSPSPTEKPHPISMEALAQRSYDGGNLKRGRLLADVGPYKRYLVTYRSDGLTVSGIMHVPDGKGPFPVLVLNHGYIDPDTYFPGQGMAREQDYLARQGYVVLHTDYRGHATSDDDPDVGYELRLPYVVDTINAVYAVKRSKASYLDGDRVGWLGRSMGGGVTLGALVAQPGLVDAAVIYASVSSLAADNWRTWNRDDTATNRRIARTYGLPDESPRFWRAASPRPYLDRVTEPLLVHHGEQDDTCPIEWSERTVAALKREGKEVTFARYDGEGHTFEGQWRASIRRTERFFDRELR